MLVVECFVLTMRWSMEYAVTFEDVLKTRFLSLRHALSTKNAGITILFTMDAKACWGLGDCLEEWKKNICPGYQLKSKINTPMRSQLQQNKPEPHTSLQIDFIVWRQSVSLVVW
jgi:hypothetical protein